MVSMLPQTLSSWANSTPWLDFHQALIFKDMPSCSRPMKIHVPNKSMFASIFAGHTSGGVVFGGIWGAKNPWEFINQVWFCCLLPSEFMSQGWPFSILNGPSKWAIGLGRFAPASFEFCLQFVLFLEVEADMCLIEKSLKMPCVKAL